MRSFSRLGLRSRLVALVCLALVPTMGVLLYSAFSQRRAAMREGEAQALESAASLADQQAAVFDQAALVLQLLSENPSVRGGDVAICVDAMAQVLRRDPAYANLGVVREDGTIRASVLPVPAGVTLGDRPWFRQALATGEFAVGPFQVGRITGKASISAALPFVAWDGGREVLFASLDLDRVFDEARRAALPEGSELLILDSEGKVLLQRPHHVAVHGRRGPESLVGPMLAAGGRGSFDGEVVKGEPRIYGHAAIRHAGREPLAYVAVGLSADRLAASADRALLTTLLSILAISSLAVGAAFAFSGPLVVSPINSLAGLSERIRSSGDLTVRAGPPYGPGEIGRLERAFDGMNEERARQQAGRQAAEEALRERETLFRQMAETIEAVFWVTEPGPRPFKYVSPAFERIWGIEPQRLYEVPALWRESIHPSDRRRVQESVARHEAAGRYEETYRIVRPDGSVRWIRDRAFPVLGANGKIARIYGLSEDVTAAKDLEVQFQQVQKMEAVGRLAAGVAHDFNNLLTVITGYAQILRKDADGDMREGMDEILKAAYDAAGMTRQLLTFGRSQVLAPEMLDLNAMIADLARMMRRLVGSDVEVVTVLDPKVGRIHADPQQLRQVVVNLVVNARDAMPRGGRLTVETYNVVVDADYSQGHVQSKPGPYVVLAVSDSGVGMDEKTRERIFEPFFTTKAEGKGTGLGLATVYGIVKQSGGDIFVYSEKGQGTSFKIYFPRLEAPPKEEAPAASRPAATAGPRTLLLVEDDKSIRGLAYRWLREEGHTVIAASSAEEAEKELAGFPGKVDILVTDLGLPGKDGFSLANRLREENPALRVILMSGYSESAAVKAGKLPTGMSFLSKPFGPADLQEKVALVSASIASDGT